METSEGSIKTMEALDGVDFNKCQANSLIISSDENKKAQEIIEGLVDSTATKLPMSNEGRVVSNNVKEDSSTTILGAEMVSEVKSESKTRTVTVPNDVVNNQTTDVTKTTTTTKETDEKENFADASVSVINAKTPVQKNESSNISTRINLQKIFTPATDAEEISPRNRKLYASSAFYSPNLHPTVEDQVELARRISHSLSDISNQKSKGQSMYVNRKKRSVKWVHEGSGIAKMGSLTHEGKYEEETKENTERYNDESIMTSTNGHVPLKLVMNPRGKMQDFNSASENFDVQMGLMSPDKCAELVIALNTQNDKGSELFAKRRRKAEKWVVNEFNPDTQCPSGLPDDHEYHPKPVSPSILSDLDKQLNVSKTSCETASIEKDRISTLPSKCMPTNSVTSHYTENHQHLSEPVISEIENENRFTTQQQHEHMPWNQVLQLSKSNRQRNLAYRPNIPQGWKAPSVTLSSELYVPKEIPLQSYAPPPTQSTQQSADNRIDYAMGDKYISSLSHASSRPTSVPEIALDFRNSLNLNNTNNRNNYASIQSKLQAQSSLPLSSQRLGNNGFMYAPPKQLNLSPNSYQIVPQETGHIPQINFNPSPIPYDKLAKFENPSPAPSGSPRCVYNSFYPLSTPVSNSRIRDVSSSLTPLAKLTPPTSQSVHRYPPAIQRYCGASNQENDSRDSFNHPIHGWSASDAGIRKKLPIGVTAYLPYTDF